MKIGKKRWLVSALICMGVVLIFYLAKHGPSYEGKDINYWFKGDLIQQGKQSAWGGERVTKAFQSMGAAAVPYLRAQLTRKDSRWSELYWKKWQKWPPGIKRFLPLPVLPLSFRQQRAAMLLGMIGPPAGAAVPDLVAVYDSAFLRRYNLSNDVHLDWSKVLASPKWTGLINSASAIVPGKVPPSSFFDEVLQDWICRALVQIGGDNKETIPLLLARMKENNQFSRPNSLQFLVWPSVDWGGSLACLAPSVRRSEPELIKALMDSEPKVRALAARFLGLLLPERSAVIQPLLKTLRDQDVSVRGTAANSLGEAQTELELVVPALCGLMADMPLHSTAVQALTKLAGPGEKHVPLLNEILGSPDDAVRAGAAEVLGNIGPKAVAALPKLTELAKEPDRKVRYQAAEALWKIDHQAYAILPFHIESLKSKDEMVRWNMASFMVDAGPQAKSAVPALIEMLQKDESNRLRGKAAMALGEIGPDAKSAIPALRQSLQDEYSNVQAAAKEALKKIDPGVNR